MQTVQYGNIKVRKTTNIRNQYNQVPHLKQETTWESVKSKLFDAELQNPMRFGTFANMCKSHLQMAMI